MAIVRAEPFPSLSSGKQCLSWSSDSTLALTLENGIFAVRCGLTTLEKEFTAPKYTMKTADQVKLPAKIIHTDENIRDYDVSVPRSSFQADLLKGSNSEYIELMWNRTASPSVLSGYAAQIFLQCSLSPPSGDKFNRSVMCTVSVDHRTSLYSRGEHPEKWKKIVDLCQLLYEKLDCEEFESISQRSVNGAKQNKRNKQFQMAKDRSYAMATVAVDWSHMFDDGNGNKFVFVFGTMRSGHVAVWKMKFPVINSSSCKLADYYDITVDHPVSIKWCQIDDMGFVAIGYNSGKIRSFVLGEDNSKELVRGKVIDLWQDEDQMPIVEFAWSKENNILYAAKGPYVLVLKLQIKRKTLEMMTVSVQHTVVGAGSFHMQCLDYKHPHLFIQNQESVFKLTADTMAGLKLDVEEVSLERLEGNWRLEGMVVSPSRVFMALANSPSKRYCHLSMRNPIKLTFHSLMSTEEICDLIIKMDYNSLDSIADVLMSVKQYALKEHNLPAQLQDFFLQSDSSLSVGCSLKWLKVVLCLFEVQREVVILLKTDENEINEKIKRTEELIIGQHCIDSLAKLLEEGKINCLSDKEKKSAYVMCQWLGLKTEWMNDEISTLVKKVRSEIQSTCDNESLLNEECIICKKSVLVTDHVKGGCENKHVFARCTQTLLQLNSVRTRKCQNCDHLARCLEGRSTEFKWLAGLSQLQCTFCDSLVI